jgi:hypothetical protein
MVVFYFIIVQCLNKRSVYFGDYCCVCPQIGRGWVNWVRLIVINRHGNRTIFMNIVGGVPPEKEDMILVI